VSRVERIGDATLILGDCREVLRTLRADHIISDPPYEDELHAAVGKINRIRCDGRRVPDDLGFLGVNVDRALFGHLTVAASDGWLILFSLAEGVRAWRDVIQAAGGKWDTTLAWIKPDASPRFNGQGAARGFECAITAWCGKGYRRWNGGGRRGVFTHNVNGPARHGAHPTEKPTSLMMELVALYSQHGETILDPFMGSGTTGVACAKLGRKFVGIEIDPGYFEIACKRISEAYRQADLFVAAPEPAPKQEALFG
jgi:site-specific DNA-methyltransferase (adenine-specific)